MKTKEVIIKRGIDIYYKINYILEFLLAIPFAIFVLNLAYHKSHAGLWYLSDLIGVGILGLLLAGIIVTNIIKHKEKLEKMFITFAIPIGMMYAIYMLPTYVPDEQTHLYRAYQISIGNFIEIRQDETANVNIPQNILNSIIFKVNNYTDLFNNIQGNNDYSIVGEKENVAQSYFPTLYMFSSLGLFIGKMLLLNPIVTMYLAKVLNFIAYLVLGYFAIRKIPFGKMVVLAYLMLPMVLQQAISMSADSLTNSVAIFFIAYTLYIIKKDSAMTQKEEILYYILVAFIALAKIAYMPLALLSWLLIGNKNYEKRQKLRVIIISTLLAVMLSISWYGFSMVNYPDTRTYIEENGVNGTEQIKYVISHPIEYAKVILNTIQVEGENYIYMFVGKNLGWLNINTSMLTIIGFIVLVLFAPFLSKKQEQTILDNKQRLWMVTIFAGIFLLVLTGLYIGWTAVGGEIVIGVQGRYFIPIVILLLLCMCMKEKYMDFKHINVVYPVLLTLLNLSILKTILRFFM